MSFTRLVSARARDILFDLGVHVLWADGRVTPDELSAARGMAIALGLDTSTFGGLFGRASRGFESLGLDTLGPLERPLAYACAVWMALADRELAVSENLLLQRTRRVLGVGETMAQRIESMAYEDLGDRAPVGADAAARAAELGALLDRVVALMLGHEAARVA
jgi:hypothetical protein